MNKRTRSYLTITAISAVMIISQGAAATCTNGDFSSGLDGWNSVGGATVVQETAQMCEDLSGLCVLYQATALDPGMCTIDFDFSALISEEVADFAFPDTMFVSLYFTNDASSFDLSSGAYGESQSLFDMDCMGLYCNAGSVEGCALGGDWRHFSYAFENNWSYVIPVFELYSLNGIDGDSTVRLDNVILANAVIIPEPSTFALLGVGLAAFAAGVIKNRFLV